MNVYKFKSFEHLACFMSLSETNRTIGELVNLDQFSISGQYVGVVGTTNCLHINGYEIKSAEDCLSTYCEVTERTEEKGFNPDSLENLHRAKSESLFELAKAVKEIEKAGTNGGIAQQIDALKKISSCFGRSSKTDT